MKKALATGFLFLSILFVSAPNVGAITIEELQAQINALMAQLTALQAQQNGTTTTGPTTTNTGGKFQIGDSIIVTQDGLNVRATPYGTTLGSHQLGALGTINSGPQKSQVVGDNSNWWNVNYQDGVNGWSIESGLKKVNNTTNNSIKYVSFLFPVGGETLVKGQTYYFRFTGRDIGVTNYDVYLYDGRNGPPPYTGPYDSATSVCPPIGCSISSAQTLIGHTSRTNKDVDVFAWTVPTNLESKQGYQIHLVSGNNTSRNVTGAWSGAVTIADNTTTTTSGSTVTLYVDGASTVTKGSPVILRFSANNVSYCVGPDTLTSPNIQNSTNGFNTVYPTETTIYSIHCYRTTPTTMNETNNPDASASVTITVGQTSVVTPTVSLSINSSFGSGSNTVTAGTYKVLDWSSTNADSCQASGGWSGYKAISGSQSVGPINQNTTYTITCISKSGSSQPVSVTINVGGQTTTPLAVPTVTFSASPTTIIAGQPVTLNWSSTNATFCGAGSGWGGQKGLSGSEIVYPTTSLNYYYITCTGNGQANANATINVTAQTTTATLSAPTLSAQTGTQCDSVSLSWTPVAGASYYKILRDGYLITIVATSYVDSSLYTSLTPSSLHTYTVSANDGTRNSPNSNAVNVTSSASCSTIGTGTGTGTSAPTTNDPNTDPNYSQTSSIPLSSTEKTVNYTYPYNPCGGLMTSYTAPGSVSVGNGPVYVSASTACAPSLPNTASFRVYSCHNNSSLQGQATFAFQCNAVTSSANASASNVASVYESLRGLLQQLSNQIGN